MHVRTRVLCFCIYRTASTQAEIDVKTAINALKQSTRKFDETIDIAVQLGVDPRKPNQSVRGVVTLPNGTGKTVRVAVFARGVKAEEAKAAGATIVGAEDLVELVQSGKLDFDRCIATPDMMGLVGRVARVRGAACARLLVLRAVRWLNWFHATLSLSRSSVHAA